MESSVSPEAALLPLLVAGTFWLAIVLVSLIGLWKVFTKAGQPGWAVLIPFYNLYVLLKIVGKPGWWMILFFIPIVGVVIAIMVSLELAKAFGKSAAFGIGLVFLGMIFYPILGFGSATYKGVPSS